MAITPPIAVHDYEPGGLDAALTFLKRTRYELRQLRKVRAARDVVRIFDVNNDVFEIRGLGYADPDLIPMLEEHQRRFRPEDDSRADDRGVQGVQDGPLPSLGRRSGVVIVAAG